MTDEFLRSRVHGVRIEMHLHMPGKTKLVGERRQPILNAIAVGAADRGKARVEALVHFRSIQDHHRMGLAMEIQRPHDRSCVPGLRKIHMADLPGGVDAGVCATGAANGHLLTGECLDGTFDHRLDGRRVRLALPAAERPAVIFHRQFVAGHYSNSSKGVAKATSIGRSRDPASVSASAMKASPA